MAAARILIRKEGEDFGQSLKSIPTCPGIYTYWNQYGQVLYVGKSKNLRQRVRSYFVDSQEWEKAKELIRLTSSIQIFPTDTHLEAMLAECQWIQEKNPPFNQMMASHKNYVFFTVSKAKGIQSVRQKKKSAIGPFRSRGSIIEFQKRLRRILREGNFLSFLADRKELYASAQGDAGNLEITRASADLDDSGKLLASMEWELLHDLAAIKRFYSQVEGLMLLYKELEDYDKLEQMENLLPFLSALLRKAEDFQNFLQGRWHLAIDLDSSYDSLCSSYGAVSDDENVDLAFASKEIDSALAGEEKRTDNASAVALWKHFYIEYGLVIDSEIEYVNDSKLENSKSNFSLPYFLFQASALALTKKKEIKRIHPSLLLDLQEILFHAKENGEIVCEDVALAWRL